MDCDIMQRCMKFRSGSYRNEWAARVINLYMTSLGTRFQTGWLSTWGKLCVRKTWSCINREVKSSNAGTVKIRPVGEHIYMGQYLLLSSLKNSPLRIRAPYFLPLESSLNTLLSQFTTQPRANKASLYREILSAPIAASAPPRAFY